MKDEYGFVICHNDIRRRPDIKKNKKHNVIGLSVARCAGWGWVKPEDVHLCVDCSSYVDAEGDFLNTI